MRAAMVLALLSVLACACGQQAEPPDAPCGGLYDPCCEFTHCLSGLQCAGNFLSWKKTCQPCGAERHMCCVTGAVPLCQSGLTCLECRGFDCPSSSDNVCARPWSPEAGSLEAGSPEAGSLDAGSPEAGSSDAGSG